MLRIGPGTSACEVPGGLVRLARLIGGLQRARELADYDAAVTFSAEDAQAELGAARHFIRDALAVLTREGWVG